MESTQGYQEIKASPKWGDIIHSFWVHRNLSAIAKRTIILPDSFFKIVIQVCEGEIINYFMTGLWTKSKEFTITPNTTIYGCRLKILAPEFLLNREIASILDDKMELDYSFLNPHKFDLSDFEELVKQWESELIKIRPTKKIEGNKLRLSQLLYQEKGSISASEVSRQIYWTNRQINRYLGKYLGVSLKKYLNIQKCYAAYPNIRDGVLYPEGRYFDQSHFIKEVRKHAGETPKNLYTGKNDRFIQLGNIQEE